MRPLPPLAKTKCSCHSRRPFPDWNKLGSLPLPRVCLFLAASAASGAQGSGGGQPASDPLPGRGMWEPRGHQGWEAIPSALGVMSSCFPRPGSSLWVATGGVGTPLSPGKPVSLRLSSGMDQRTVTSNHPSVPLTCSEEANHLNSL